MTYSPLGGNVIILQKMVGSLTRTISLPPTWRQTMFLKLCTYFPSLYRVLTFDQRRHDINVVKKSPSSEEGTYTGGGGPDDSAYDIATDTIMASGPQSPRNNIIHTRDSSLSTLLSRRTEIDFSHIRNLQELGWDQFRLASNLIVLIVNLGPEHLVKCIKQRCGRR